MLIRRFSPELKTKVPGGHPGVYAVPIQLDGTHLSVSDAEKLAQRMNGLPILLNQSTAVVAMYIDQHGSIDEHSASGPILFLVMRGRGFVRIGGPDGETREVSAGDAVLWPVGLDHTAWTEDEPLEAIVIEL